MATRITRSRRLVLAFFAMEASTTALGSSGSNGAVFPIQTSPLTSPPESWIVTEGRPLRRRGRLLVGRSRCRARAVLRLAIPGISAAQRAVLAAHWRRLAELEHASIIAFEQLGEQLDVLGAPAALLRGCARAAIQEQDHAERCFQLASRYEGAIVVPGRLRRPPMAAATLIAIATESLHDGTLNEGYAAWIADQRSRSATDPQVIDTLRVIARDEAQHAELAWQIVRWCAERGGEPVRRALLEEAFVLPRLAPRTVAAVDDGGLGAHGMSVIDADGSGCDLLRRAIVDRLIDALPGTIAVPVEPINPTPR